MGPQIYIHAHWTYLRFRLPEALHILTLDRLILALSAGADHSWVPEIFGIRVWGHPVLQQGNRRGERVLLEQQ